MPGDTEVLSPPIPSTGAVSPRDSAQSRDQSLDIARGFGILLVVLGHVLDGLIASGFFPVYAQWPSLTVYVIYLFHMPLFFVISGYLASGRHRPAGVTIKRLIPTIVYPYFLWSVLEGLMLIYLTRYTNNHVSFSILYRIPWVPIVPYWFLYALFCCHLLYLVVRRFPHRVQLAIAVALFFLPVFSQGLIIWAHLIIFPETVRGFLYFIIGVISVAQVKQFGRWTAITTTVLFILFATIFYQSQLEGVLGMVAQLPAAFAGIAATLAWSSMLASRGDWIARVLAFWGRYSMSIYVMHIFITAASRIALQRLGLTKWYLAGPGAGALAVFVELAAATILGVLVPLAVNRIISQLNLDKWLGLQHMETGRA